MLEMTPKPYSATNQSVEKLPSMKLVPGSKKFEDPRTSQVKEVENQLKEVTFNEN